MYYQYEMFSITNTSHKIRKAALVLKIILPFYATETSGEEKNFPETVQSHVLQPLRNKFAFFPN